LASESEQPFLGDWPFGFINAIGRALTRGVRVKIFLSNVGGSYIGDDLLAVVNQIRNNIQNKTDPEIAIMMQLLTVRYFPLPSKWSLSPGSPGVSNHAKVMAVDSRAIYIGSQNFYLTRSAKISKFTYIFEDTTLPQQFINSSHVWLTDKTFVTMNSMPVRAWGSLCRRSRAPVTRKW